MSVPSAVQFEESQWPTEEPGGIIPQQPGAFQGADIERPQPWDVAAEQSVLGGMMLSKDAIGDVIAAMKPRDYYRPAHEKIHNAIVSLWQKNEPIDPIAVGSELTKRGEISLVGGPAYLHSLVNAVPTAANAEYYAGIVHDHAVLRRLIEAGTSIAGMGYKAEGEVSDIVQAAEQKLLEAVSERSGASESYSSISETTESFLDMLDAMGKEPGGTPGLSTGFIDLDSLTGGLLPGQMIVIGARPAMGKSTLALDFARACAIKQRKNAAFFSLEMSKAELTMRAYSAESRVALHHMRTGNMTDDDWTNLARRTPDVSSAPLYFDDSPNLTAAEIRSRCRRMTQQHGPLSLVVVDYLQLMQPGGTKRYGNRQEEVAEMSRQMKLLAREMDCPVVVLSQMNRAAEQRSDKRPTMAELRESGAIEQDADIIILLHREDAYVKESPQAGEADLIVVKHRNGPTADITTAFQGHYSRFVDMAQT